MKKFYVHIQGKKPILFHKFNIECLQQMSKVKTGSAGNDYDEWKTSFYHNDGQIYIPSSYMNSALKNGAVHTKVGRGTLQKTWISAVQVEEEQLYFNRQIFDNYEQMGLADVPQDPTHPVFVDVRMVANPNTKGRNVRYRLALGVPWELKFHLEVDNTILSIAQVKKVVEDTGKMQGIADARTLGYGRFEVTEFKEVD